MTDSPSMTVLGRAIPVKDRFGLKRMSEEDVEVLAALISTAMSDDQIIEEHFCPLDLPLEPGSVLAELRHLLIERDILIVTLDEAQADLDRMGFSRDLDKPHGRLISEQLEDLQEFMEGTVADLRTASQGQTKNNKKLDDLILQAKTLQREANKLAQTLQGPSYASYT